MTSSPQSSEILSETQTVPVCEVHRVRMHPGFGINPKPICDSCAREQLASRQAQDIDNRTLEQRREVQERKQAEIERRMGAACIPERYRHFTFDSFPGTTDRARNLVSMLRTYANRFPAMSKNGVSIMLIGGAGTGKTGLSCSVANTIIREHGRTAMFMTSYAAVRHLRDTWGKKGKTEREALDDLVMPDLLILDEVGTSVGGPTESAILFEVLNGRYAAQRSTILLANLPIDDYEAGGLKREGLRSVLGPRILDRFKDDGSFTRSLDWPSLRGQQHGE